MSREVRHDGLGALEIRFPFDRVLVERIKALPNRRWNPSARFWSVPDHDVVLLVDLLHVERFRFDDVTVTLYQQGGGTAALTPEAPAPAADPRQRALFELVEPAPVGATSDDLTVTGLNERVRAALEGAFPASVWVVGEVSGYNRSAHKRHVSFQLVELDDQGQVVSRVDATLFEDERRAIEDGLVRGGAPFQLEDGLRIRVRARVQLYVPWGAYRVVIEQLDVGFTLGEAARRREEIVRRLTREALVGRNTSLRFPELPLRVGLVTSLGSDAYNDVRRTLEESGFAFELTVHGARVQGRGTEPSVLNALDWFGQRLSRLDVLLICRGGGSRTDLAWFDSEALGRAVALFPIPVVVGIGHEQDTSVLDAVGWRAKTPTAAAALLVETVRGSLARLDGLCAAVLEQGRRRLEDETHRAGVRERRLAAAARASVARASRDLAHVSRRTTIAGRATLAGAAGWLAQVRRTLPRAAAVHLTSRRTQLESARRAVAQGSRRDAALARERLAGIVRALGARPVALLERTAERHAAHARRLHLVDPRRVVERGYAILRLAGGRVLTRAALAPAGAALTAELIDGRLQLRSEGPVETA